MAQVQRNDFARLDGKGTLDPRGFLRVRATPATVGIFEYRHSDGSIIRELRPPEEVFDGASLATYTDAPLTIGHPESFVSPQNSKELSVGHSGPASQADTLVACHLLVEDGTTIQDVQSEKLIELSCGYYCELDPTPGEWEGQPYDAIQRDIRVNHIALLPRGMARLGPEARIRNDSAIQVVRENQNIPLLGEPEEETQLGSEGSSSMITLTIDGTDYQVPAEVKEAYEASQFNLKVLSEKADNAEKRADKAEARADKADSDLKKAQTTEQSRIDARVQLQARATQKLGDVDFSGLSDHEIRLKVVETAKIDGLNLNGKSEAYVEALFDAEMVKTDTSSLKKVNDALKTSTKNDSDDDGEDRIQARRNSWRDK